MKRRHDSAQRDLKTQQPRCEMVGLDAFFLRCIKSLRVSAFHVSGHKFLPDFTIKVNSFSMFLAMKFELQILHIKFVGLIVEECKEAVFGKGSLAFSCY